MAPVCSRSNLRINNQINFILLPAPISLDRPPLRHILPCELRRQVSIEGSTPGFCSLQPWFSCRAKVGFERREGERQAFDEGGGIT
ncbi:MAG: hypothetical protein KKG76_11540 [Euryarchaeota archaeon]|nr:hypothetical protein [Euryarchaeota archaeon]